MRSGSSLSASSRARRRRQQGRQPVLRPPPGWRRLPIATPSRRSTARHEGRSAATPRPGRRAGLVGRGAPGGIPPPPTRPGPRLRRRRRPPGERRSRRSSPPGVSRPARRPRRPARSSHPADLGRVLQQGRPAARSRVSPSARSCPARATSAAASRSESARLGRRTRLSARSTASLVGLRGGRAAEGGYQAEYEEYPSATSCHACDTDPCHRVPHGGFGKCFRTSRTACPGPRLAPRAVRPAPSGGSPRGASRARTRAPGGPARPAADPGSTGSEAHVSSCRSQNSASERSPWLASAVGLVELQVEVEVRVAEESAELRLPHLGEVREAHVRADQRRRPGRSCDAG